MTSATATATPSAAPAPDLRRLFLEHHRQLVCFVRRYAGNHEDAEDVVQSAFVEALRGAGAGAPAGPAAWLFGIALCLARSHAVERREALAASWSPAAARHADPADLIALRQMAAWVETLLRDFPPTVRATFEVVVNGDCSYEEAADHLDLSVGMVRLHMSHVGAMIRRLIGSAA